MGAPAQNDPVATRSDLGDAIEAKFHELFDAFVLQLRLGW